MARHGNLLIKDCTRNISRIHMRKLVIAYTTSQSTLQIQTCCLCRNTGMSCGARMQATHGLRSAEICPPISVLSSTFMPTNLKRSTSFQSKVMANTIRRMENSASIAVAQVATNGRRLLRVCHRRTVTSTCFVMRWLSIRLIHVAYISELLVDRSMRQLMVETLGRQ